MVRVAGEHFTTILEILENNGDGEPKEAKPYCLWYTLATT